MIKFLNSIWGYVATALMVLFGLIKWEKAKNKELKEELQNKDIELDIKEFEAEQNKIRKGLKNEEVTIKPNSDITI